jgi:hypothetical protein
MRVMVFLLAVRERLERLIGPHFSQGNDQARPMIRRDRRDYAIKAAQLCDAPKGSGCVRG